MADLSFDAVVVGGGSKTMITAMYLAKFGGMKVGVFEDKAELGGGWCSEESPAPGFIHNTCATGIGKFYFIPIYEDFPDFEEKGVYIHPVNLFVPFKEDDSYMLFYNSETDPTQERGAKTIVPFSQKDADTWLWLWNVWLKMRPKWLQWAFNPAKPLGEHDVLDNFPEFGLDFHWMFMSMRQAIDMLFESPEMRSWLYKFATAWMVPLEYTGTAMAIMFFLLMVEEGFVRGGTHSIAHACQRILQENGVRTFRNATVEKIIVENGRATGIRLADGRQVAAKQLVVTNVNPHQLLDLAGEKNFPDMIVRKVKALSTKMSPEVWYGWATHEAPNYKASKHNPDVNQPSITVLAERADPESFVRKQNQSFAGVLVPDPPMWVWCWTTADPRQAPPGKHTCGSESFALPATALTERQWMKYKEDHAEHAIKTWQQYAPNMTWDNVIGYDPMTPYDHNHLLNARPHGNPNGGVDGLPHQSGRMRPIPELAQHRTPVKGLYATGSGWHPATLGWACQGYNCYKVIAEDLRLPKPWEKAGRAF